MYFHETQNAQDRRDSAVGAEEEAMRHFLPAARGDRECWHSDQSTRSRKKAEMKASRKKSTPGQVYCRQ
jgi:hypothetical protein